MKTFYSFNQVINEQVVRYAIGSKGEEVKKIQQKLIDLGLLKITNPTGTFGAKTDAAVKAFQSKNGLSPDGIVGQATYPKLLGSKSQAESTISSTKPKAQYDGFVVVFAFPEYEPRVDGTDIWSKLQGKILSTLTSGSKEGTYGKLGHGGVATINKSGTVVMFEFGRYPGAKTGGYGLTRQKEVKVRANVADGQITNLDQVLKGIRAVTYTPGPTMKMEYVVLPTTNIQAGINFAKASVTSPMKYAALDFSISNEEANCGTFALQVAKNAGVNVPDVCIPTPNKVVQELRLLSLSEVDGTLPAVA